jgi:hypothetical protein
MNPDGDFVKPEDVRFTSGDSSTNKPQQLVNRAAGMGLLFDIKVNTKPSATAGPILNNFLAIAMWRTSLAFYTTEAYDSKDSEYCFTLLEHKYTDKGCKFAMCHPTKVGMDACTWENVENIMGKYPMLRVNDEQKKVGVLCAY